MGIPTLPADFREFLKLLNSHHVEYLLVGGYAVGFYGYPRATADMDIWVALHANNAKRLVAALEEFGFNVPELRADLFLKENKIIRLGVPPFRIEILTTISGVSFEECYARRQRQVVDALEVDFLGLADLKTNKKAAGRHKDLDDLEHLP